LPVARLADRPNVQKVFAADFEFDAGIHTALDTVGTTNKSDRNMCVAIETDLRVLVVEAIGRGKLIKDIGPFFR